MQVVFTARLVDAASGVASAEIHFVSPSGATSLRGLLSATERRTGTANDGYYRGSVILPGFPESGRWTLRVNLRDVAGNVSSPSPNQLTAIGLPTSLSVLPYVPESARRLVLNDTFSSFTRSPMVSATVSAPGAESVRLSNSPATGPDGVLSAGRTYPASSSPVQWDLTDSGTGGIDSDGEHVVYAQWLDPSGSWSPVVTDLIRLDRVASASPFDLNGGAARTSDPLVVLRYQHLDASGVSLVRLSSSPETADGLLSRAYEGLPTLGFDPYDLTASEYGGRSGNGMHTVYAQFQDGAGNWSPVVTRSIELVRGSAVMSVPFVRLDAGSVVGPTVPAQLFWVRAGTTECRYEAQQSVGGAPFTRLALDSPTTSYARLSLRPGHRYTFRTRTTGCGGRTGPWSSSRPTTLVPYEEASPAVTYSGAWTSLADRTASGGRLRWTSAENASASFTFTGTGVSVLAPTGPTGDFLWVWIDGVLVSRAGMYSSTPQSRAVVFSREFLVPGAHTITVVNRAAPGSPRVELDGFLVTGG